MSMLNKAIFFSALALSFCTGAAYAQGATYLNSAGNPGSVGKYAYPTWQDVQYKELPNHITAPLGHTFLRTGPQGLYDVNGPQLPPAATTLEAPKSGMAGPIPSGPFTFGFPATGYDIYRGGYSSAQNFGGYLPPTSTSSVNLNTVDLGYGVLNVPVSFQQGLGPGANLNTPGWYQFPGADGGGVPPPPPPALLPGGN